MFAARAGFMASAKSAAVKGSVSFSGSSYLEAVSTSFYFGTGSFTIELWYRANSFSGNDYLFDMGTNGTRNQLFSNTAYFLPAAGNDIRGPSGVGITTNTWHHLAMVRSGSNLYQFINGTSYNSTTNSSSLNEGKVRINGYGGGGGGLNGYISNFRIVAGTAVYTSNFTPPTSPLTAISGTKILTCQNPTSIIDNGPNALSLTTSGSPTASSLSPFA